MPDVVNQTMNDGNQFNIDQVNNLVDNDTNYSLCQLLLGGGGGSWHDPGAGFSMDAKIEGGESKIDADAIGDRTNVHSSADAVINQSAFDQNITQGANIQFNSITIQAAGDNLNDQTIHSSFAFDPRGASRADRFFQSFHFRRCSCRQEAAGREA